MAAGRATPTFPIDDDVVTTAERTIVPLPIPADAESILPFEVDKYAANGYGRWEYGPGVPHVRRTDLVPAATAAPPPASKRLLRFFTITDVHITDQQSPAQAIIIGYRGGSPLAICAYSMVMPYTVHVLDAVVQTINALHAREPFDFGIGLGDAANSTQHNELRWYIDVIDGKTISPRSGTDADSDELVDYLRDFQAAGLDPSIPWFQAIGNHDQFWMGVMPADDNLRKILTGTEILNLGDIFSDPAGMDSRGLYMGSLDCSTEVPSIIGIGPVTEFPEPPQVPSADPRRQTLSKAEWLAQFLDSPSEPAGHGFDQAAVDDQFACYSFLPNPDVPVKMVVLDNTQSVHDENVVGLGGYGHGSLDRKRFDWLVSELEAGQAADQLMVVACHIPIRIDEPGGAPWWSQVSEVREDELVEALQRFPNLILWIAGHRHLNTVTVVESPDPARPELGFFEVETFSLRDFPQEFRTFDVHANGDGTLSIVATSVDPAVAEGSLAAKSRDYAVASYQLFTDPDDPHAGGPVNVELVVPLTPEMAKVVDALA